jgi:hypothetical protein
MKEYKFKVKAGEFISFSNRWFSFSAPKGDYKEGDTVFLIEIDFKGCETGAFIKSKIEDSAPCKAIESLSILDLVMIHAEYERIELPDDSY